MLLPERMCTHTACFSALMICLVKKDTDEMANIADPDQTGPSVTSLFAQTYRSPNVKI